jgi:RNA polymerase sigma factor (sigma-70 family)
MLSELISKAIKGEEASCQILFDNFKNKVLRICLSFTNGDRDLAQDLCQDSFVLGFKQLHTLRDHSKFSQWLSQITYNLCKSYLREKAILSTRLKEYEQTARSGRGEPGEEIRREQIDQIIHALIDQIPKTEIRETVNLFYIQGKSTKEIAALQEISQSTVTTRLDRFRTKIQRHLMLKIMELRD